MKTKLLFLFFLMLIPSTLAYTEINLVDNGTTYDAFLLNTSELPFIVNKSIQINFTPYFVNNSYYFNFTDNNTNTTNTTYIENSYWVNHTNVEASCGNYFNTCYNVVIGQNTLLNYSITMNPIGSGMYDTYIRYYVNATLVYEKLFKFFVTAQQEYNLTGVLSYNENSQPSFIIYTAELPFVWTKDINIHTQPNEILQIQCNRFLTCSGESFNTTNLTRFTTALIIPTTTATGFYNTSIYLNTSYNKTLEINYSIELRDSPIKLINNTVFTNKDISEMTPEELIQFFESLGIYSSEAIRKLAEANRTSTIEVPVNVPTPYLANKDELIQAFSAVFTEKNKELYDSVRTENIRLTQDIDGKAALINDLNSQLNKTTIEKDEKFRLFNLTMTQNNYIFKKQYVQIGGAILFLLVVSIVCFIIIDNNAYPWNKVG